jgi:hypothetical protein
MSKQTALQWLFEEWPILESQIPQQIKDKAFEMEQKQIVEAHGIKEFHDAEGSRNFWQKITGEQYYKEQYEREDNKH